MSQQLISRSEDLARLRNDGYDITVVAGHLLVRDVPYLTPARVVARGTLISTLNLAGEQTAAPETHVVYFAGETPCKADGTALHELIIGQMYNLAPGLQANFQFSHKPAAGYPNYYDKMVAYANILVSEAAVLEPDATAMTFGVVANDDEDSPFSYIDTASSRAGIATINGRLAKLKIAIVGLGGTGSYILDLIAKTPISEIHLWDGDRYLQHNAFRSPGAATLEELEAAPTKVDYWVSRYAPMRTGVVAHPEFASADNVAALSDVDFVFLALDGGDAKRLIVEELTERGTPFIDVGMGIYENCGKLAGLLVTTMSSEDRHDHVFGRIPFSDGDGRNEYARNIQIAELNALNAALAVVRWKKHFGVYDDFEREHYSVYAISDNSLTNDESAVENDESRPDAAIDSSADAEAA
jgi:hypothetical protein